MRIELIEHGHCECLEFGDSVASLVDGFLETGAFEANDPADQLTAFFAISDEGTDSTKSGQLRAIIRYIPVDGQEWPNLVVETFGAIGRQRVYRRVDNGPDEVYGVERIY